jgi:hypothetical protein
MGEKEGFIKLGWRTIDGLAVVQEITGFVVSSNPSGC